MAKARQQQIKQTSESRVGDAALSPRFTSRTAPASRHPQAGGAFIGVIILDTKQRASVVVTENTPTTFKVKRSPYGTSLRLNKKFVKFATTFRVPKCFKRIFKLLVRPVKSRVRFVKPKPLHKAAALMQKRVRAPTKRKRKANDEDAEGDADSHGDFWFATVKPRAQRAPHFRAAAGRGIKPARRQCGHFWLSLLSG